MPLGAFIKPSQEDLACGGKRAFHMCCMMKGQVRPEGVVKIIFSGTASVEKNARSSAAGGDDFIDPQTHRFSDAFMRFRRGTDFRSLLQPVLEIPVPPPKTFLPF